MFPCRGVHGVASLLKRWLLGTHQDRSPQRTWIPRRISFRFNRRHSRRRGLLFQLLHAIFFKVCADFEADLIEMDGEDDPEKKTPCAKLQRIGGEAHAQPAAGPSSSSTHITFLLGGMLIRLDPEQPVQVCTRNTKAVCSQCFIPVVFAQGGCGQLYFVVAKLPLE